LTGHSHDYKRNGTSKLFAAFEVAAGKVTVAHKNRRRRVEFLMNEIVAAQPDTAIHVILDNLNTHKPKNDRWLKRHPNVHFHLTPTRASWLNLGPVPIALITKRLIQALGEGLKHGGAVLAE
jgi:hypothetical protein